MTNDKYVLIMADYMSDGLWDREGRLMEQQQVPASPQTLKKIQEWVYEMEAHDPLDHWFISEEFNEWNYQGRELASQLKRELPDWTIIYFDKDDNTRKEVIV